MAMYMNGSKPFHHPVTGQLVAPYAWYEGAAHIESEQVENPAEEEAKPTRGRKAKVEDGE